MLVLSKRARETKAVSETSSQFSQMVDRRLSIAQMGLAEVRQHLAAGQTEDADLVLEKIDEDLVMLRCRIRREVESFVARPSALLGSTN